MKSDLPVLMAERDLDALLVLGDALHNPSMVYFTGVTHVTDACLLLKRGGEPVLFYNPMERDEAAATGLETQPLNKYNYRELFRESQGDALLATARMFQLLLGDMGVERSRVAIFGRMDSGESVALVTALSELMPAIEIVGEYNDTVLLEARATKDEHEVEQLRSVARKTVEVVDRVANFLTNQTQKDGVLVDADGESMTVARVKAKINLWLAEQGLENPHGTIFAPGSEGGVPHSTGSPDAVLKIGEPIVFDIFPVQAGGGYFADFTRTWCLGYAPEEVQALYDDVRFVYDTIMGELKPDTRCRGYQDRTCELFAERGHPTVADDPNTMVGYVHGLAHGLGLDIHEAPRFSRNATSKDVLKVGSVVTIEPGLYYPERGMGMRLEDAVYVRPGGENEILAPYSLDLVLPLKS